MEHVEWWNGDIVHEQTIRICSRHMREGSDESTRKEARKRDFTMRTTSYADRVPNTG